MTEHKLFVGDTPRVSTAEFHEHRQRAPHLEQYAHQARLGQAVDFVRKAAELDGEQISVSDLGCGDGGLLSEVVKLGGVSRAWGYDFQPSNRQGWAERGVPGELKDVFGKDRDEILFGRLTVVTEVLEHLADPHEVVRWISQNSNYLVASSPYDEHSGSYDECHAWAWDVEGYAALVRQAGFQIVEHTQVDAKFQVLWAVRT